MRRDPDKWLEDILTNGHDALEFLDGKTQEDYVADKALRAMVEHKASNSNSPKDNSLQDSPPPGFEVIRSVQGTVSIRHRRTGMGCINFFLAFWLAGWAAGCGFALVEYLNGEHAEDGSRIPFWFVGIFYLVEVGVGLLFTKLVFERSSFQFKGDTLTIEKNLLGKISRSVVSKDSVTSIMQVQDGGTGDDSFPSWGLKVEAGKSYGLLIRQPHEQSAWLGQVIATWAEKKFDPVPQ